MPIDFSNEVYAVAFNVFGRPITVLPIVSQPGAASFGGVGIFDSRETDVLAEDGSLFSDSKTILDIRIEDFPMLPMQGDIVDVSDMPGAPGGQFEIADLAGIGNAGGEITLTLKRWVGSPLVMLPPAAVGRFVATEAADIAAFKP
jgi:hypothetical protein